MTLAEKVFDRTVLDAAGILCFDIETFPARVEMDVYDLKLRNPYIHHRNVVRPGGMLCWAAQWYHEPNTVHYGDVRSPDMLQRLHAMVDAASYCVTFAGDRFDLPKIKGYFARAGLPPVRPPKSIDLLKTIRKLGFESNSLEYACRMFDTPHKKLAEETGGASGWKACLEGDEEAWRKMRVYNVGDVRATMDLYDSIRPLMAHPPIGFAAKDSETRCPRCGSADIESAGVIQAETVRFSGWRCLNCSGPFRSTFHSRIAHVRAV